MNFTPAFISDVKHSADIVTIIGKNIPLKKRGANFWGLFPFHTDKNPSMQISRANGYFKCWSCGAKGDVISWVMYEHDISFYQAINWLVQSLRIIPPESITVKNQNINTNKALYRTLHRANSIYQNGLAKSPIPKSFLVEDRGLNEKTIKEWGIGLVSKGVKGFLGASEELLIKTGICGLNDNNHVFERLIMRITIPILDHSGKLVGFAGRRLELQDLIIQVPKYLNPPSTELFRKNSVLFGLNKAKDFIRKSDIAIVVEGYFDVIALYQYGEKRAVASMGTAIADTQLKILFRYTKNIAFCFDGDSAGQKAAKHIIPIILSTLEDGQSCSFIWLPTGHDPDTYIREYGISSWLKIVENAEPLSSFLIRYIAAKAKNQNVESSVNSLLRAKKVIQAIKAPLFRKVITNHITKKYNIDLEAH
ncbi:DNA primase [Xenorhabdus nematophila]|uniref:DNA primase n=1 Tax=Xenorhabdus nematophila TaxID=628 RepID=UPI0032B85B0A